MITPILDNLRKSPQVLVENKISFAGPESELSIYDTFQQAQRVKLKSDQLLFCAMVSGKKIMHSSEGYFEGGNLDGNSLDGDSFASDFLPQESFIMKPDSCVEIDFPIAKLSQPTTCLAIEISSDRIKQVAASLNEKQPLHKDFGHWHYQPKLLHTQHNSETQGVLNRIVQMYSENHPNRDAMIALAVSELTIRLLNHQTRDFMLSFSAKQPDHNGLTAALCFIRQHLNEHIDIDDLARLACMSRTKFFNEFKQHLGCSPIAFQQQSRLKKAAVMLKNGDKITTSCFALGFTNTSHFSRTFKQFYGFSPSQYKKRYLNS